MGYKRAGFEVVLANDIDPEMAWHYQKNLHPPHYVLAPIRELIAKWPAGLSTDVDLLDGSPPCSSFSMSGSREKKWGKKKHFREGQTEQVLDDLFFDFLDVMDALRPRAVIAENVVGLVSGQARGYVKLIFARFRRAGYVPQLFRINAARCGVPQARERVFFCALRDDQPQRQLVLAPNQPLITAAEACSDLALTDEEREETICCQTVKEWWPRTMPGEAFSKAVERSGASSNKLWNWRRLDGQRPAFTLSASCQAGQSHWSEMRSLTFREWIRLGAFPDDYYAKSPTIGRYMIGMSVPPKMTEAVAAAVRDQWLA